MFGKIDLGLESSVHGVAAKDFNSLDAYGEVVAAVEASAQNAAQLDMLQMTAANIERGNTLAMAVADATGDQAVAVTVGAESFSMAMGLIGYGDAGQIVAGAESVTAGVESISDMAKKVMDTIKKYAKKAFEFARVLLVKVMNFLKGLFGKKESTSDDIEQLVKDAKNDGRIKLDVDEFSETIQTMLAKEIPVVLMSQSGKSITGSVIEEFIDKMTVSNTVAGDFADDKRVVEADKVTNIIEAWFGKDGSIDKTDDNAASKTSSKVIIEKIAAALTSTAKNPAVMWTSADTQYNGTTTAGTLGEIGNSEIDKLVDDNWSVSVLEINKAPNKISYTVLTVSTEAKEAYDALAKDNIDEIKNIKGDEIKDIASYKSTVGKMISGVNVVSKILSVDSKDYLDDKKNIKPLEVNECLAIAKKLKAQSKDVDKNLSAIKKAVDASEKVVETNSKKYERDNVDNEKDKNKKGAAEIQLALFKKVSGLIISGIRATSNGNAIVATELGRSKFGHIVKESARLWSRK